ncbi:MAG: cyclopropane-fatty-acyl-phospholipid synthase family protein [Acidobacteriota bacterium]
MSHHSTLDPAAAARSAPRWLRSAVLDRLNRLERGTLVLMEEGTTHRFGGSADAFDVEARVEVRDPRFWSTVALGGSIGAAEAYMDGFWTTPDLTAVMRVFSVNMDALNGVDRGLARFLQPLRRLAHWRRNNSRSGSRRNIAEHYDLGNAFYRLFLDETMMYSCAFFEEEPPRQASYEESGRALASASRAKLDRIARKLDLRSEDHLLEVGTGWGGFALHAAEHYGCRVTTTTISRRQYEEASARIQRAGLESRVTVLLEDYRDLRGTFDKLVSIEMIEAVGLRHLRTYFRCLSDRLSPRGLALVQAITMQDPKFLDYRRGVDFIQRYIFPGAALPSLGAICDSLARSGGDLQLIDAEEITAHYAPTLRLWRERFLVRGEEFAQLGFDTTFRRMWEYYLSYCEGGFRERIIGDFQLLFAKPMNRRPALPSDLRAQEIQL